MWQTGNSQKQKPKRPIDMWEDIQPHWSQGNAVLKLETIINHSTANRWVKTQTFNRTKYWRRRRSMRSMIHCRGNANCLPCQAMWHCLVKLEISLGLKTLTNYNPAITHLLMFPEKFTDMQDRYENVHSSAIYNNENRETFQKYLTTREQTYNVE